MIHMTYIYHKSNRFTSNFTNDLFLHRVGRPRRIPTSDPILSASFSAHEPRARRSRDGGGLCLGVQQKMGGSKWFNQRNGDESFGDGNGTTPIFFGRSSRNGVFF